MWGKILGVAALSIAASCAVLTVDVDVYKGPMANEPDVQAQQLTAIAVAARPVLIQLRDELERSHPDSKEGEFKKHVEGWPYVFDKESLESTQARVVNGVLGLYLDKVDPVVASFVGRGRDVFEECTRLREQMERFEHDEKLWKQVDRTETNKAAYDALSRLIAPPLRADRSASDRKVSAAAQLVGSDVQGATRQFEALSDADRVLPKLAALSSNADLLRKLADRTSQISKAYLAGRAKLAQGLDLALSFQMAVALHRAELQSADAILASNAKLISLLIQPQQLALLMSDPLASRGVLQARQRAFLRVLPRAPFPDQSWSPDTYDRAAAALEQLLIDEPVQGADALRSVHTALLSSSSPVEIASRPSAEFRFGLARALTLDEAERAEIVEAFKTFRSTVALLGDVGLDGGRLDDGLLTMIHRYLEARDREHAEGDKEQETSKRERKRLMDGLVHFAEKLRFLASHDAVLGSSDQPRESVNTYVMALESIGNSILTLANEEQHRLSSEPTANAEKARARTQANAIKALEDVQKAFADLAKSDPTKTDAARAEFAKQLAAAEQLVNTAASLAVYIRPPWAYLRNSTPISALQPGEGRIDNLLTDHAHGALLGNGNSSEVELMAEALNRQFWQNINRVRVAGMGNTSYVLVKDDIGNWYVKGYSADPTPVLEGLQSMALAAQSGAMGMDLFARKDAAAKAGAEKKAAEPVESATMVGKQAQRFEKIYADEAKADSKGAREEHAKFVEEVSKAWEKHTGWEEGGDKPLTRKRKELTQELSNARAALAAAPVDEAKSPLFASDVLAVLAKSLEFQEKALALLDEAKLVNEKLLIEKEKLLTNAASGLENARNEVELARARLKAIEGVVGALQSEIGKAKSAVVESETKLASATEDHQTARNERDAEAKRVAAAKQLVSDLRADVRSIVGGAIRRRLEARRKSSESYSTALEVLSQSSEPAN